ncbi:MAG: hypothetical protein P4L49_13625 [Desulfosporosinus sp.]|nr:hypothetical protein [Desulfosporosinus sp.]
MKRNGKSKKEDKRKSVEQVMGYGRVFLYLCLSGAERAVLSQLDMVARRKTVRE